MTDPERSHPTCRCRWMMARAAICPDCECPPWRCPELATAQSISAVRRQPGPCSIASRARASRASRLRRTGTGTPAHVAVPRKPAISATIISAWPRSAPSCSGSAPRPEPCNRKSATKLHLPFELLSDDGFRLTEALGLPTFAAGGLRLLRRLTLVVRHAVIEAVFYPIFPPDRSTVPVIDWLASRQTGMMPSAGCARTS